MSQRPWVSGGATVPDPSARESTVATPDGRTLGIAEYGPVDGFPIFSLHGTPACRYGGPPLDHPTLYEDRSVRVIGYDRPGYGLSTRHPGRTVADAAADVATIADTLGLGRFAVTGGSGGGPHCLAAAALLPDRVTRVACVVGAAPLGGPGLTLEAWLDGMTQGNIDEFTWSLEGEAAMRPKLEALATDELTAAVEDPANIFGAGYELSDGDRAILADPRRHERIARVTQEAFRHGIDGWVDDNLLFVKPWGFELNAITAPAMVWYGLEDTLVPQAHGEWLAAHVPNADVVRMEGGHMELSHRVPDLIEWLAGGSLPADATKG
ncbi:MAG: alpha/beta hydrolase [Actinomycetes bacterium]